MKEADAIGVDLGKSSKTNSLIIKEVIGIYFDILKNKSQSPLLKSVFLGMPQFTQYINIELVWDLIAVMTEYLKEELKEEISSTSNLISCLLCCVQIVDLGVGQAFNVDDKAFIEGLY